MSSVNPKLLIGLIVVIACAVFVKLNNPHRAYGTQDFWEKATVQSVYEIPDAALKPGNKNGPVLMWAAMFADDPEILELLVERGADVNESDGILKGTPLTGAASYTSNPKIIDKLIELGADVNKKVHFDEDALMLAARYNKKKRIIERLIYHGADTKRTNDFGRTALDIANSSANIGVTSLLN